MSLHALIAVVLLGSPPLPPAPSLGTPQRPAVWRSVETAYRCSDEEGAFSVGYDDRGRAELRSARRADRVVAPDVLHQLTQDLNRLDTVFGVHPECADTVHILTAAGSLDGRRAAVLIIWTPYAITATAPVYDDEYPLPPHAGR